MKSARTQFWIFLEGSEHEGHERVDHLRPWYPSRSRRARLFEHAPHDLVMDLQLCGYGADRPLLHAVKSKNLDLKFSVDSFHHAVTSSAFARWATFRPSPSDEALPQEVVSEPSIELSAAHRAPQPCRTLLLIVVALVITCVLEGHGSFRLRGHHQRALERRHLETLVRHFPISSPISGLPRGVPSSSSRASAVASVARSARLDPHCRRAVSRAIRVAPITASTDLDKSPASPADELPRTLLCLGF